MTQNEIIEMTKQAKLGFLLESGFMCHQEVKAFAKLIAEKEREACAKYVEECSLPDAYSQECLPDIANEIRTRGQA